MSDLLQTQKLKMQKNKKNEKTKKTTKLNSG